MNILEIIMGQANVATVTLFVVSVFLFCWGTYNKIKYLCLEKASKFVADVEQKVDLTGEEKFSLVLIWILKELPKIFKNALFKVVLEKIINVAYNSSFDYMKNYIKRKTGTDVSSLIESVKKDVKEELNKEGIVIEENDSK